MASLLRSADLALIGVALALVGLGGCGSTATSPPAGTLVDSVAAGLAMPTEIRVDDSHVYFLTAFDSCTTEDAHIMRVPLSGGAVQDLAQARTEYLALDAQRVYWSVSGGSCEHHFGEGLGGIAKSGGPPTGPSFDHEPDPGEAHGVDASATGFFWLRGASLFDSTARSLAQFSTTPRALAVDTSFAFVGTEGLGKAAQLFRVPLSGGAPTLLSEAEGASFIPRVAVDEDRVYWTTADPPSVNVVDKAGGANTVLSTSPAQRGSVAVDALHVYWLTDHAIVRMPKRGGKEEVFFSLPSESPHAVVVDSGFVYWASDKGIFRRSK